MHTKSHDTKDPMCDNPREIGEEALDKLFFFLGVHSIAHLDIRFGWPKNFGKAKVVTLSFVWH